MSTDRHSLYFLGSQGDSPLLKRYVSLIEQCKEEGDFLSFDSLSDELSCYGRDAQPLYDRFPLLVFRPYAPSNIAPFIRFCHEMDIPVAVRCGGTGLSGGCIPSKEGIILLTGHLKKIKEYDKEKGLLSLEPGVTPRQIHHLVRNDGWYFPLSMSTEGVAGIAGCLNCHARGYHQQHQCLYDGIENVTLVNGFGKVFDVPVPFVCGSEGMWGVIIEIRMALKKLPESTLYFSFQGSWNQILERFSSIRAIHPLKAAVWFNDYFYFKLEGERWRIGSAAASLQKSLPALFLSDTSLETISHSFRATKRHFCVISTHLRSDQLQKGAEFAMQLAAECQLDVMKMADLLAGTLHLILESEEALYLFAKKIEDYLVLWTDFVDKEEGIIAGTHGVGMVFCHYMTPFWSEESLRFLRHLQTKMDPKRLFGRETFFPVVGKSLEKVRDDG